MCGDAGVRSNIYFFLMTMCLELISADGQVYVTLERVSVVVVSLRKNISHWNCLLQDAPSK